MGRSRIYGYPGDGINGVIGALQRADKIEFVQVRHEEMAAFMAVAHAKFTGEIVVCLSTGGPGATPLLTGLYDAKLDHAPILAICGQAEATVRGANYQQELNLDRMFSDAALFAQEASAPAQVRHLIDRCVRVARASNGPTVLVLPKDIQDEDYEEPAVAHGFTRSGIGYSKPKIIPEEADLAKAAEVLNAGSKIAILIGADARGTAPHLTEMATLLGAGVAKALLGKDVLSDDLPFVTGAIGLLGTEPSWDLMQGCDTLLLAGTGFPWSEFLSKDGAASAVQIDIDASMLSLRYPAEVNLHGDAADTLKALLPLIRRKDDRDWSNFSDSTSNENMTHSISSTVLRGTVVAVASKAKHEFSKRTRQAITLVEDYGVEGDAHAGRFMQHRYLARKMPIMPNNRQVHLIASELFTELGSSGFNVAPGDLGENITTAGLDLTKLPLGTRLRLGHSAVVELTGLRTPCSLIDRFQKGLKRAMILKHEQPMFRCGVLGVAKAPGEIAPGDPIIVELPSSSLKPLPAL